MKKLAITFFLLMALIGAFAQAEQKKIVMVKAQWPIKGAQPGENIISKPGQYINGEHNYADLFIRANKGDVVTAPEGGTICSYAYIYRESLVFSTMQGDVNDDLSEEGERKLKETIAANLKRRNRSLKGDVAKYVTLSIGIKTATGSTYYISGLSATKLFKTGDKVAKGEAIGSVAYAFSAFDCPHIVISRDSDDGKCIDPMSVFGIPSTFNQAKPRKYDYTAYKNPVDSLKKDFDIFRQALEQVHPGLYDYTPKAKMDSLFKAAEAKLVSSKTSGDFIKVLRPIMVAIGDSHTSLSTMEDRYFRKYSSVILGYDGEKVFVESALPSSGCRKGEEVVAVDGESVLPILKNAYNNIAICEGYNKLPVDRFLMEKATTYLGGRSFIQGKPVSLKMKSGRVVTPPLIPVSKVKMVKYNDWAPMSPNYSTKMINPHTAYLDINTFELNQVEEDSIERFVSRVQQQGVANLIVDVRDNRGGEITVGNRIISYFTDAPLKVSCYKMVKSNTTYPILSCSDSWLATQEIFPEFKPVAGKEGFYYSNENDSTAVVMPNGKTHYTGNVVILANEYSTSMASDFPAALYGQKNCVVVGRETGSSYYQMNAEKFADILMPATGLKMRVPMIKIVFRDTPNPKIPWGHGVIPDYVVPLTYNELVSPKDVILDRALQIIDGNEVAKTEN